MLAYWKSGPFVKAERAIFGGLLFEFMREVSLGQLAFTRS